MTPEQAFLQKDDDKNTCVTITCKFLLFHPLLMRLCARQLLYRQRWALVLRLGSWRPQGRGRQVVTLVLVLRVGVGFEYIAGDA